MIGQVIGDQRLLGPFSPRPMQAPADRDGPGEGRRQEHRRQGGRQGVPAAPEPGQPRGARRPGQDRFAGPESPQVLGQRVGARVAVGGALLQALQADHLQVARQRAPPSRRRDDRLVDDLHHRVPCRVALERRPAGERLVQDGPQRVDVGLHADARAAGGLLGGHVAGSAEDLPGLGQAAVGADVLGEAEVGDFRDGRPPVPGVDRALSGVGLVGKEDVGRLQVAMDDPGLVRRVDRPGDRLDQGGGLAGRPRGLAEPLGQRPPLDVLHREEGPAETLADLIDLDDVGMLEAGQALPLHEEAEQVFGAAPVGQHHLQRHHPVRVGLPGEIDDAHPAPAQLPLDPVAGQVGQPRLIPGRSSAVPGPFPVVRAEEPRGEIAPERFRHGPVVHWAADPRRIRLLRTRPGQPLERPLAIRAGCHVRLDVLGLPAVELVVEHPRQVLRGGTGRAHGPIRLH